jgi:glycosyltransferase involved in cell wall biosynthesis
LDQTYHDFELIISDNGSIDKTEKICQEFSIKDRRIRYVRSNENQGASWNYNRTVELARGEYFRWLAHDDAFAPQLLEKSVAVLDQKPEVVSCITRFADIDEYGNVIELKRSTVRFDATYPHERFRSLSELRPSYNCEEVFGLVRLDILRQTKLIANYVDSDRTLIAELSLHGPFFEIEEPLFLHRLHAEGSVVVNPTRQERTIWFDPSKKGKLVFPHWRQLGEFFSSIRRSPLSNSERMKCYSLMLRWMINSRGRLRRDLAWAVNQIF